MPIYGYSRTVVDPEFNLMELREVSFDLPPDDLRRVAAFLQHYAELIESGEWKSDHIHLESFDSQWRASQPDLRSSFSINQMGMSDKTSELATTFDEARTTGAEDGPRPPGRRDEYFNV